MSLYTRKTSRSQLGHLKISLFEDSGALVVTIFEARGLARKNGNPLDTYVKLYLLPDPEKSTKEKTKIVKDKDPRYNERFSFILSPEDYAKRLHISVWAHYSTARNELIGCMSFLVADLLGADKGVSGWYQLLDKDEGRSNSTRVPSASPGEVTVSPQSKNYAVTMVKGVEGYGFSISSPSPVFITKVEEGLPAHNAGIQAGDVLVEVEGTDVTHASGEQIINIIKKYPDELSMILQRPITHQTKQRRQSASSTSSGPHPWPHPWLQSHSQSSIGGGVAGSEVNSCQPLHVRSLSDQPFVPVGMAPSYRDRQVSTSREKMMCSMDKIMEEDTGGQMNRRPPGRPSHAGFQSQLRRGSMQSQSSERSVDGNSLGTSSAQFVLPHHQSGTALGPQSRRHSNQSQFSQRSLGSQDQQVTVAHVRSRSQPASSGTEDGEGEEEGEESERLSALNTGSKHTSGSDSEVANGPSSTVRHGSFLSLNRRSPTKDDSAYSSEASNLNPRPVEGLKPRPMEGLNPRPMEGLVNFNPRPMEGLGKSVLKRRGSIGSGVMETRNISGAAEETVIEWSMLGSIGQKKQKAINNLMNTEYHFCEVLRLGTEMYLDPLRDILPPDQHDIIFHHLEELYFLSYDISTQLKSRCQQYCSSAPVPFYVESVGAIYHSRLDRLIATTTARQNQWTQTHDQVSYCFARNNAFNTLVENAGQRLSIQAFVDATNEYLPKLARFLMGVSYFTPLWHEDHKYLTAIIRALVKICPDRELTDKWLKDQDLMESIKVRLGFEAGVQPFIIVIPGRVLLFEGEVTLIAEKKKKKKIWLMLFSDILVIAKKQGKLLVTTETPFFLEQLTVSDLNCDETEFQVASVDGKIKYLMKVGSAQEKGVWVLTLKEWTNGTHAVPNGIPTRTNGSLAVSHGSLLPANGGLLSRHGSVSVHKMPSPPKFASSSLTQPDSSGFPPSERFVQFSQPAEYALNNAQPRSRAVSTTAVRTAMHYHNGAPDAVEMSRRSL